MIRHAAIAAVIFAAPLAAQQPNDSGRVPVTQSPASGSSYDGNRVPSMQSAGSGVVGGIQSFPDNPLPATMPQQYLPRPSLNPYLNLIRGTIGGGGFLAIDYYNFVRPAQQSLGSYAGRQYGTAPSFGGASRGASTVDPETGLATGSSPAGAPSVFMNYGGYFNRLGTIGPGAGNLTQPNNSRRR